MAQSQMHQQAQNANCRLRVGRNETTELFCQLARISHIFLFNRDVVDQLLLHFLTACFISETFAVKLGKLKSYLILNDFCPPEF